MGQVASTIPNLVSGVSQQPAPSRLRTSGEVLDNGYPSIVSGLMKRPPVEWRSQVSPVLAFGTDARTYFIDRSPTERYMLLCGDGDLELYDLDGVKQTLTFPNGKAYLPTTDANSKLRFVTVADTTFILNIDKVVSSSAIAETRANPETVASVFIKKAVASVSYAIYVDGVLAGTFTTSDNTTAGTALEGTSEIASSLATDLVSNGYTDAVAVGTTVTFGITSGEVVSVADEFGGASMRPFTHEIQEFSDLPPFETEGRLVRVRGGVEDDAGAYWVKYVEGIWEETVGYNEQRQVDASTMPHVLVKTAPNTFEFRENNWNPRPVGDTDSNPDPSFVGSTINSLFLHKGRLGFLSEENMICSATALFEDIYRTTVVQLLDTDPIDVASATGDISTLYHALPLSKQLLLFSNKRQFRVTSGQVFSPKTVGIDSGSSYPSSTTLPPLVVGSSAYFLAVGATHSVARELFFETDGETLTGEDISVQVPKYIPKNIRNMVGSETNEMLVTLSGDDQTELFVYKWYTTERRKRQSAWGRWTIGPDSIIGMGFIDQHLYLATKVGTSVTIERMALGPVIEEPLLLDHWITETSLTSFTYDAGNDRTVLTLETGYTGVVRWFRTDDNSGDEYTATKNSDTVYYIDGDITTHNLVGGLDYTFRYQFSTQYLREDTPEGEAAIQDGRLQLQYFSQIYSDSSYFEAHVTPTNGSTKITVFNGRTLADPDNITDVIPRDTGEFKFPIFAQNEEVKIELINDQPYRCAFGSAEWTAQYRPKARRV